MSVLTQPTQPGSILSDVQTGAAEPEGRGFLGVPDTNAPSLWRSCVTVRCGEPTMLMFSAAYVSCLQHFSPAALFPWVSESEENDSAKHTPVQRQA